MRDKPAIIQGGKGCEVKHLEKYFKIAPDNFFIVFAELGISFYELIIFHGLSRYSPAM